MKKLKVLDLFSGIGGFSLGLERTGGFETVAFCEIDTWCRKVLNKHWPSVPIYEDVRTLDYDGPIDVITGGYPCQPFSLAGKRKGADDDRHLWPAMFSLIKKHRPAWVIGENVAGHVTMGLDNVLSDLASENYNTRAFVIPACAVNAPHRRDRVWIIGHANKDSGKQSKALAVNNETKQHNIKRLQAAANTASQRQQGQGPSRKPKCNEEIKHRKASEPFPVVGWPTKPAVCGANDGVSGGSHRLRGLGNAVVPQIPETIGNAILVAESIK